MPSVYGLERSTFVLANAINATADKYGKHDIALVAGLLYHFDVVRDSTDGDTHYRLIYLVARLPAGEERSDRPPAPGEAAELNREKRAGGLSNIVYAVNGPVTVDEFIVVLVASALAQRRPVDDRECMENMVRNANLVVTARRGGQLIGVARSMTDFSYAAYLSDLAVDRSFQRRGIGRELIRLTRDNLGPRCTLILLSAPAAVDYYPRLGFERHPQAWVLRPESGEE
ncbi:MAG: GNAT family N-acetyltransferase [Candidatus Krumholzibacteriia bacterium]